MNGKQGGDLAKLAAALASLSAKLAAALVILAALATPPLRFVAGADIVAGAEQKAQLLLAQVDAHRELSSAMDLENA